MIFISCFSSSLEFYRIRGELDEINEHLLPPQVAVVCLSGAIRRRNPEVTSGFIQGSPQQESNALQI